MSECWRTKLRYHADGKVGTLDLTAGTAHAIIGQMRIRIENRKHTLELQQTYGWDGTCEIDLGDGSAPFAANANPRAAWGHLPRDQAAWRIAQIADGATQAEVGGWRQLSETLFAGGGPQLGRTAYEAVQAGRTRDITILSAVTTATGGVGAMFTQQQLLNIIARLEGHPASRILQAGTTSDWKPLGTLLEKVPAEHREDILVGLMTRIPEGFTPTVAREWGSDPELAMWACQSMEHIETLAAVLSGARAAGHDMTRYRQTLRSRGILGMCAQGRPDAYQVAGQVPGLAEQAGRIAIDRSLQALALAPGADGSTGPVDMVLLGNQLRQAAAYGDLDEAHQLLVTVMVAAGLRQAGDDPASSRAAQVPYDPDGPSARVFDLHTADAIHGAVASLALRDPALARDLARDLLTDRVCSQDPELHGEELAMRATTVGHLATIDPELRAEILAMVLAPASTGFLSGSKAFSWELGKSGRNTIISSDAPGIPGLITEGAADRMAPEELADMLRQVGRHTRDISKELSRFEGYAEGRLRRRMTHAKEYNELRGKLDTAVSIAGALADHAAYAASTDADVADSMLESLSGLLETHRGVDGRWNETRGSYGEGRLASALIKVAAGAAASSPENAAGTILDMVTGDQPRSLLSVQTLDTALRQAQIEIGGVLPELPEYLADREGPVGSSTDLRTRDQLLTESFNPGAVPGLDARLQAAGAHETIVSAVARSGCYGGQHQCGRATEAGLRMCESGRRRRSAPAESIAAAVPTAAAAAAEAAAARLAEQLAGGAPEEGEDGRPEQKEEYDRWLDSCEDIIPVAGLAAATGAPGRAAALIEAGLRQPGRSRAAGIARNRAAESLIRNRHLLPEKTVRHLSAVASRVELDPEKTIMLARGGQPVPDRMPERLGGIISASQHPATASDVAASRTATQLLLASAPMYPIEQATLDRFDDIPITVGGEQYTSRVIRNPPELERNKHDMVNCTDGLNAHLERGDVLIAFRNQEGMPMYNAQLLREEGRLRIGEINSRNNRGEDEAGDVRSWLESQLENLRNRKDPT